MQAQVVIATEQQARVVARYGAVALAAFWEVENALAAEPFLAAQLPLEQKSLPPEPQPAVPAGRYRADPWRSPTWKRS